MLRPRTPLTPTCGPAGSHAAEGAAASSIYDFTELQYGKPVSLDKYRGQVLVIVNIASE
jgi:hypothetical protein